MLEMHQKLPKPLDFWASNYQARVDADACSGCGACEERCQVGAVRVSQETDLAAVDLSRCIGCGLCVPVCPEEAISLIKKSNETRPPKTREELYDIIMSKKKGRLGKAKLTGKLIADTIRTGRRDLI
jgi:ferredoxin